ncbi:MAG: phosphonoacetaldehyde reductase [bacterium]|nr:phosphonoacetaldehyde reductase [bacterium]
MHTFSGEGAIYELDRFLTGYKGVLLFNGKKGFHASGAADYFAEVKEKLKGAVTIRDFSYSGKALPMEDVDAIYKEVRANAGAETDLVIAVGGGTVMDLAKIIGVAYSNGCENAQEVISGKELENSLDLLFIPTTAGTGSEATSFAVVYQDKVKLSIDRKSLLPGYVVLDPLLLKGLPDGVLNTTILDALSQAIESAWAKAATDESREYSKQAIRLILDNISKENTSDRLSGLQSAAHLAGKAINITRTTLSHSISYPFTAHFDVPHGVAVFLTLAKVAELNYYATPDTLQPGLDMKHIQIAFSLLFDCFGVDAIGQLTGQLNGVLVELGFSLRLRDYGVDRKDLPMVADNAFTTGRSDNNPRKVDRQWVLDMLETIL